ncbi:MAG: 3D domain-containing protein [Fimbriimonadaceae bacterium]
MRKIIITSMVAVLAIALAPINAIAKQDSGRTSTSEVKTVQIPYEVKYIFNRDMSPGRVKKVTDGKNGQKITTITSFFEDGKKVDVKTETTVEEPKDAVFHMGNSGLQLTDRGSFSRSKTVTMEASAYLPTDGSGAGRTASGIRAKYGVVAVDPRVIKIGTLVYVEGYGLAVAADTGGAIKGNRIDVCMHDRSKAMQWGRRKVKVHIFTDRHTAGMAKRYR